MAYLEFYTLSDKQGWAVLISTPRARNWFFDFHSRGLDPAEKLYRSYSFSSLENPYFPREEFEEARRTTSQDIFRQEYEAQFLEDSAGVFRNMEACLLPTIPTQTGNIAIGCDIAKHTDWTVLIAMDKKTALVWISNGSIISTGRFRKSAFSRSA